MVLLCFPFVIFCDIHSEVHKHLPKWLGTKLKHVVLPDINESVCTCCVCCPSVGLRLTVNLKRPDLMYM